MRFTSPGALWLGLLAIPVVLLHVLRPRRHARTVSSTYLWRALATPVAAASPWQRLRPNLLLLLQLLAVALLAIAAARPARVTDAPLAKHTVFIVDTSGSMASLDGDPDRVGTATATARRLRDELPAGGAASLVEASARPRVLLSASPDGEAFDAALRRLRSTGEVADFATAFTLAESLETPESPIGFVLLSDGGLTDAEKRLVPPGTRYERTGDRATNRAVTRLAVEPQGSGLLARVSVRNTGGPATRQRLRLDVDGTAAARVDLDLPRGALVERSVTLPAGDRVEAFLEGEDLLDADDHRRAVAARRRPIRVLHAGPDNLYLDRLLSSIPGVTVERGPAGVPASGFDLAIYDRVEVPTDPGAPFLAIAPPSGAPGVTVDGVIDEPAITLVRSEDALLAGVDLADVGIAAAQRVTPTPGDEVLVAAADTPLLLRGERSSRPFAYLAFALDQSNLPLHVAFPILGDRLLGDLAGSALAPAEVVVGAALPLTGERGATIDAPGGSSIDVEAGAAAPIADRPGFWVVREHDRAERVVAVNPDPAESSISPAQALPIEVRPAAPGERAPRGERSLLAVVAAVLLVVLLVEALVSRRRIGVGRRQARVAFLARLAVAALVGAALTGATLPRPRHRVATMFLIDASDSMGQRGRAEAVAWVRDALASQPHGSLAGVALFGGDARLELTVQEEASLLTTAARVDADRTDLAGALRLAAAVLPEDARRRVVVVSDGRITDGDSNEEAQRLRSAGIQVDVHPVERAAGVDAAVTRLDSPSLARRGEVIPLQVTVTSTSAAPTRIVLTRDGATIEERTLDLVAGDTVVDLAAVAGSAAVERYRVQVFAAGDTVPQNDVAFAAVQVEGPAKVLVAEGSPGAARVVVDALRAGGIDTDVIAATALPPIDELVTYSSTVLADVNRRDLESSTVADLAVATRDLGRGLVVLGGDSSYALGGYLDSDLEELLPVVSDVLDPKRRSSVAQVLAIDTSGSMGACHCAEGANGMAGGGNFGGLEQGGINKTDISRSAAARTMSALSASDEVGVLAFNTEQDWIIDLQQLPAEDVVREGLGRLRPDGGTDLLAPLLESAEALRDSKAKLKHIILFTDGFTAETSLDGLVDQAAALREEGITVSVLATGEGSSKELRAVAEAGGGRFHPGRDLEEIPEIMMEEAVLAARDFINEGTFHPVVVGAGAAVDRLRATPALLGFTATTAKPAARTLLRIGDDDDPLLATWQAGLATVTAWTSDGGERWSQPWSSWNGSVDFWSTLVKETFPSSTGGGAVSARAQGDRLQIRLEGERAWPEGATAIARVAGPDRVPAELRLERVSGTVFEAETSASAAGSYAVGVQVRSEANEPILSSATVATQSYSPEYSIGAASVDSLVEVSEITDGRGVIEPAEAFDVADLPAGRGRIPLAGWLLLVAALLWPVAVALSRLALSGSASTIRRRASSLRSRLPSLPARPGRERPAPPSPPVPDPAPARAPTPTPETIGRLLERKRRARDDGEG